MINHNIDRSLLEIEDLRKNKKKDVYLENVS